MGICREWEDVQQRRAYDGAVEKSVRERDSGYGSVHPIVEQAGIYKPSPPGSPSDSQRVAVLASLKDPSVI